MWSKGPCRTAGLMWTPTQSTSNRAVVSNFRLDRCIRTLVPRLIVFRPLMLRDHDTLRLKRMILFFYVVPSAMNTPIGTYVRSLTLLRNVSTSLRSRLESRDSDWAAERTCDDAVPVSDAPRCTSAGIRGNRVGALGGLLHVAGDFLRRCALLFHGGCNRRGDFGELFDRARDFLDGVDGVLRGGIAGRDPSAETGRPAPAHRRGACRDVVDVRLPSNRTGFSHEFFTPVRVMRIPPRLR